MLRYRSAPENRCRVCGDIDCTNEMCDPTSPMYMPQLGSPECKDFWMRDEAVQPLDYPEEIDLDFNED